MVILTKFTSINKYPNQQKCEIASGDLLIDFELQDGISNTAIDVLKKDILQKIDELSGSVFIEGTDPSLSDFQKMYSEGYFECVAIDAFANMFKEVGEYLENEFPQITIKDIYSI